MARIKLTLPERFPFTTTIPIRITDLNYGGHVGNDTVLALLHEARVQRRGEGGALGQPRVRRGVVGVRRQREQDRE